MIDVCNEELIPLAQVPSEVPMRPRAGKPTPLSAQSVMRWATHGLRGIKLETVLVGAARYTTKSALNRFIHELTALRVSDPPKVGRPRKAVAAQPQMAGV